MRALTAMAIVALGSGACSSKQEPPASKAPADETGSTKQRAQPRPARRASGMGLRRVGDGLHSKACVAILERFIQVKKASPRACKTAKDCAWYPKRLVDCGGGTDRATAATLKAIGREYQDRGCRSFHRCPLPMMSKLNCVMGRCEAEFH